MKHMILTATAVLLFGFVQAQWSAGVFYNHSMMQGSGAVSGAEASHGMSFAAFYRLPSSKFSLGLEVAGAGYNQRHYGATFLTEEFGLVSTDVRETDGWMQASLLTRFHFLSDAVFEPYAEGRAGFQQFFTAKTSSAGQSYETGQEVLSSCEMNEYITPWQARSNHLVAGLGLGTIVNLKKLVCDTEENYGFEVKLDLGASYMMGTQPEVRHFNELNPAASTRGPMQALMIKAGLVVAF